MTNSNRNSGDTAPNPGRPIPQYNFIRTYDGRWRLGIPTMYDHSPRPDNPTDQQIQIVRMDPETNAVLDAVHLPDEKALELRDLLVETFGPPRECPECPFST